MAEVMNMPAETLDRRRERQSERKEKSVDNDLPPPPPASSRRRDRDSRERREERDIDIDRLPPPIRGNRGGGGGGGGDFHDRNRSPPPPPRERERDYKRRLSPSPPPYRDRRHSPPPFKRSRRDDGYDGRRRSPRGGFGPDDRRFGYDYAGGYDRGGAGGRPGYAEDRPHGRYMNRSSGGYQSGPSDWDSGRVAFNDVSNVAGSSQREGLMSYKQFIQELEDDILPAEAERRYQEYRSEYISTQKRAYFDAHKDEDWLRDKYHPTNLLTVIERRNEHARKIAKDFLLDLQSGTLDLGPGINAIASGKSGQATLNQDVSQDDIEQAHALLCKLDKEKGVEDNMLWNMKHNNEKSHGGSMGPIVIVQGLTSVKGLEGIELLDTLITYLWRIHGVDYYGMIETNEAKGLRHVRMEGKNYDDTNTAGADWEKKLDSFLQGRLQGRDPLEIMTAKEKIETAAGEVLDPYVRKIRDEKYGWKYGCGAKGCTKLFHASEFVHKHLRLKHPELVMELTLKLREDLYFQNYMNDADAPGGTPIMQQPLPKEKPQRRRPVLENRLRDDRGNRREHERADRVDGDERYDRNENSPSRDFPTKKDDPEGRKPDDPMYDNFAGQGMRAAPPFPSDIPPPPPVLMPVPGAGPLGPFVPAPPEVAMRMLREQGGPSPFEGNGRKGRNGPQVSGPGPMLGVSPAFRQDPRRIRSYQDLDAPEDEVTVIDYRSL
ncbi:hypothetical protein AQUCO_01400886v1 [Aquilegia coerulea]|uniref:C2H2-type domain-containing protein n=1 Tax=Aquilegia coerulea TaxID=218851 RepID=A0A2G5DYL3_AQUCA|nr:hypothetical protein AQUCO_01400886v1 [Aquilegia coerulea]